MPDDYVIVPGEKITAYTSTFPARRYWYRHDYVILGSPGVALKGCIQVRYECHRYSVITCFNNFCVVGYSVDWLIRMNLAAKCERGDNVCGGQ